MVIDLRYGPDRTAFVVQGDEVVDEAGARPFHGIISRGLLSEVRTGGLHAETWWTCGHLLGDASNDPDRVRLERCAHAHEVLSFAQSARVAQRYAEGRFAELIADDDWRCELWDIKEGHTSSVWLMTLARRDRAVVHRAVLNVARDREGGAELRRTAAVMHAISELDPEINLAAVVDVQTVSIDRDGVFVDVTVTENEWISGDEVHLISRRGEPQRCYVAVERFLPSAVAPAKVAAVRGRRLHEVEQETLERDIACFQRRAPGVQMNINEGDVVWDGRKATIVAIS